MAKSTGLGIIELATTLDRLRPDLVITVGDRFETMATALAATYMNIPLAHTMGGEVSGSIDESIRHAVTKFAHLHFPASEDARSRIIRMGEDPERVFNVGCPRIDLVAEVLSESAPDLGKLVATEGVGPILDPSQPFVLISQHPVTTEYGRSEEQIEETLAAVMDVGIQAVALWPNADAGADDVAQGMRKFRERNRDAPVHFFKSLPPHIYIHLMSLTACLIGNSSSSIREGAFIGTPAVNVGTRQNRRVRGANVVDADHNRQEIAGAIRDRIAKGRFPSDPLYGDGKAGERIAECLAGIDVQVQKVIAY